MSAWDPSHAFQLPSRTIVVGAASGIGRAAATILAHGESRLGLIDSDADQLATTVDEIRGIGSAVEGVVVDIRDRDAVHAAFASLEESIGAPPEAVIHLAGIATTDAFDTIDDERWDPVVDVNMKGTAYVAQAAIAALLRNGTGSLVLTSSVAARMGPVRSSVAYAASKGGVNSMTRALARSFGPRGIRVNAISPGQVRTPLLERAWSEEPEKALEAAINAIPLRRIAEPHEVASTAVFLASSASSYITGEILEVNGGTYFD